MFKIADGREYFYQWDLDRQITVEDSTVKEVHFCNRTGDCSLVVEVTNGLANVPNIILQKSFDVRVFGYDGKATRHDEVFKVKARSKPADYVYTETEIKNWEDLKERVEQVEGQVDGKLDKDLSVLSNSYSGSVFTKATDGRNFLVNISGNPAPYSIPQRTATGTLRGNTPVNEQDLTPKQYVDDELAKKVNIPDGVPGNKSVIGYNQGSAAVRTFTMGAYTQGNGHRGSIAIYDPYNGCLKSPTPITDTDVATKGYVDTAVANAGGAGGKTAYMHIFKLLDNQTPTSYYRVYISMKTSELQGFNAFEGYDMSEEVSFLVSGWDYDSGILNNIKIRQELYNDGEYAGYAIETLNGFSRICAENFTIVSEDII